MIGGARKYEVSVWTLQDEFITLLRRSENDYLGQIIDVKFHIIDDGTEEFSFKIPMYIYKGADRIENPIWYNTQNGNIAINMRKIKVIFDKDEALPRVYEYIITKISESHDKDILQCEVTCEGLAFHELGKTGYKVSLKQEDFENDDYDWFETGSWTNGLGETCNEQPIANINYWLNKFLIPYPSEQNAYISPSTWYYKIEMDHGGKTTRNPNKIYEDEFVSGWQVVEGVLTPTGVETEKEKARMVDLEESNKYNLTQDLAEAFGVFCRYEYSHDDNGQITGRTVIFYNNFLKEKEGYLGFTYPYNTNSIKRELDSTDIITKMFVSPVESQESESNLVTIMSTDANRTGEDYILNFDYLYKIGAITDWQYQKISEYEKDMHSYNQELTNLSESILKLQEKIPELDAKITIAENAIQLDTERMNEADDLFNNLDQDGDGVLTVSGLHPATAILIFDAIVPEAESSGENSGNNDGGSGTNEESSGGEGSGEGQSNNEIGGEGSSSEGESSGEEPSLTPQEIPQAIYHIKIKQEGVFPNTVKIYEKINYAVVEGENTSKLQQEVTGFTFEYDEFGNLSQISNIQVLQRQNDESKTVYLTYDYRPKTQYENVRRTWQRRLYNDRANLEDYKNQKEQILIELDGNETHTGKIEQYNNAIEEKNNKIAEFEEIMGPALREGYWKPEDYKDCGDKYIISDNELFHLGGNPISDQTETIKYSKGKLSLIYDTDLFDEEQKSYYYIGADQRIVHYPCIVLSQSRRDAIKNTIKNNPDLIKQMSFAFYDYNLPQDETERAKELQKYKNLRCLTLGSGCQFGFIKNSNTVSPVLILTGAQGYSDTSLANMKSNNLGVGILTTTVTEQGVDTIFTPWFNVPNGAWFSFNDNENTTEDNYPAVYPRIKISSLALKTSSDQLLLKHVTKKTQEEKVITNLEEPTDYYILSKNDAYYITPRINKLFQYCKNTIYGDYFEIQYVISNADTAIYLDAIEVMKENSIPKVSYELTPTIFETGMLSKLDTMLGRVVNINDTDLKFEEVQGYISSIEMDLDRPWEDTIEIKNYKTKFEDLFSSIVAQTEEMKKNSYTFGVVSDAFANSNQLNAALLQKSILKADLNYAFNQGTLTISEEDGILCKSDAGVVAIRGGGIFTSTTPDGNGGWYWNTGILPSGINADLITTGQLDTNLVRIFAGDKLRFQMNGDGIYSYKSILDDAKIITYLESGNELPEGVQLTDDLDTKQYVVLNENGLFLRADDGACVPDLDGQGYKRLGPFSGDQTGIDRVAISWDGLTLRDWNGKDVFYADADTGDLTVEGTIYASSLFIGKRGEENVPTIDQYVSNYNWEISCSSPYINRVDNHIGKLYENLDPLDPPTDAAQVDYTKIYAGVQEKFTYYPATLNIELSHKGDNGISTEDKAYIKIELYNGTSQDTIYVNGDDNKGVSSYSLKLSDEGNIDFNEVRISVYDVQPSNSNAKLLAQRSIYLMGNSRIEGTKLSVDADEGKIILNADNSINIASGKKLFLYAEGELAILNSHNNDYANSIVMNENGLSISSTGNLDLSGAKINIISDNPESIIAFGKDSAEGKYSISFGNNGLIEADRAVFNYLNVKNTSYYYGNNSLTHLIAIAYTPEEIEKTGGLWIKPTQTNPVVTITAKQTIGSHVGRNWDNNNYFILTNGRNWQYYYLEIDTTSIDPPIINQTECQCKISFPVYTQVEEHSWGDPPECTVMAYVMQGKYQQRTTSGFPLGTQRVGEKTFTYGRKGQSVMVEIEGKIEENILNSSLKKIDNKYYISLALKFSVNSGTANSNAPFYNIANNSTDYNTGGEIVCEMTGESTSGPGTSSSSNICEIYYIPSPQ